jgi:hypothetical protein
MYYEIVVTGKLNVTGVPDADGKLPKLIGAGHNRLFKVESGGELVVKSLNLTGGVVGLNEKTITSTKSLGASILNTGNLRVVNCFLSYNQGKGIIASIGGTFLMKNSVFVNNNVIYNYGSDTEVFEPDKIMVKGEILDIPFTASQLKLCLNSGFCVIEVESTASDETYPHSHVPGCTIPTPGNSNNPRPGFGYGEGKSFNHLQVHLGTVDAYYEQNFKYQNVELGDRTRRTIVIKKVSNGREVRVFVNQTESSTGIKMFNDISGNIFEDGIFKFGNYQGWKFTGTLHRISLSTSMLFLPEHRASLYLAGNTVTRIFNS